MLGTAVRLHAGELEAVFLPESGMLGASLRHRGEELLARVDDLEEAAARGSTGGIPLLHPWANRLAGPEYATAGRPVRLDTGSPLLHLDAGGLPIHGVPWSRLAWEVTDLGDRAIEAALDFSAPELLDVFPFPHRLEKQVTLDGAGLAIRTTLIASAGSAVPVSFGYHPYLTLPGAPRSEWRVELPAMVRLLLDEHGIPTGEQERFPGLAGPLDRDYDDGFACAADSRAQRGHVQASDPRTCPSFALEGAGRRIDVTFLEGYPYAQVFAPPGAGFVCIEPMTAPTNALRSGAGLRIVEPGGSFTAAFRIAVGA
jgi:aldose 1-epimerase